MHENHRSSVLGAIISEAVAPKLNGKKADLFIRVRQGCCNKEVNTNSMP